MSFQIGDRVVHTTHGVGRIAGLVTKRFSEADARRYYEIALARSIVWVPMDVNTTGELRAVIAKTELARYREVLRSRPLSMIQDTHQRRANVLTRLKIGSFQATCELVRDLTARGWNKALGEMDSATLRKSRDGLCQEWAAAQEITVLEAAREVDALLLEGRQAHHA